MSNNEALRILEAYFNGKEMKIKDVSNALTTVSLLFEDYVTIEQLREYVLKVNWQNF